jgi:hypothetical protein
MAGLNCWESRELTEHGQAERFVEAALVFCNQRRRADHAIRFGNRIEKAGLWSGLGQSRDIGAKPIPDGDAGLFPRKTALRHDRFWQNPCIATVPVTGEVIAQHDRAPLQRPGKQVVVIQTGVHPADLFDKTRFAAQLVLRHLSQLPKSRAFVRFGKDHVKARQNGLLAVEYFIRQSGHLVSRPGPATDLGKAFFIDIDDHDALVKRSGHGRAQSRVVDHVVQSLCQSQVEDAGGMQDGK